MTASMLRRFENAQNAMIDAAMPRTPRAEQPAPIRLVVRLVGHDDENTFLFVFESAQQLVQFLLKAARRRVPVREVVTIIAA